MNPKHQYVERIFIKRPHVQSRASYVKMIREYKDQDKTLNWQFNKGFRRQIIAKFIEKHGELFCEYCGKSNLTDVYSRDVSHLATLDHIVPVSRGGRPFDPNNIKICCHDCNCEKGSKPLSEFLSQLSE